MAKRMLGLITAALLLLVSAVFPTSAQENNPVSLALSPYVIPALFGSGPGPVASAEIARLNRQTEREWGISVAWFHLAEVRDLVYVEPIVRYFRDGDQGWYLTTLLRVSQQYFYQSAEIDGQVVEFAETASIIKVGLGGGIGWRWQSSGPLFGVIGPIYWSGEANVGVNFFEKMNGDKRLNNERAWGLENGDVFLDLVFLRVGWVF